MTLNRIGRSPLGALYRSALGVRTMPPLAKIFVASTPSYALGSDLSLKWTAGATVNSAQSHVSQDYGVTLAKTGGFGRYAIADGSQVWAYTFANLSGVTGDSAGNAYALNRTGKLLARVNSTGSLDWQISLVRMNQTTAPPIVTSDGVALVCFGASAFSPEIYNPSTGSLVSAFSTIGISGVGVTRMAKNPLTGNYIVCGKDGAYPSIFVWQSDGTYVGVVHIAGFSFSFELTSVAADASGYVYAGGRNYVGSPSYSLVKITEAGTMQWGIDLQTQVMDIAITSDQTRLVVCGRQVSGSSVDGVWIIDSATGSVLNTYTPSNNALGVSTLL